MPDGGRTDEPDRLEPAGVEAGPSRSGRERLFDALLRPTRAQIIVAALLAVVGFAGVTQMQALDVDDTYSAYREQDLIDVLNGLAGTSQRAQAEITRLEQARAELRSSTSARQAALEQARTRADTLDVLAGTVPVTGPGIRVTITETEGAVDIDSLLDTIQELRGAGAEAMQFNGRVRVVADTSFEDGVGGIYVDDTLLEPPYVLDVIGNPTSLAGALTFALGPIAQLEDDGVEAEVVELQSLDIESVRSAPRPAFAEPDTAQ